MLYNNEHTTTSRYKKLAIKKTQKEAKTQSF